MIRWSYNKYFFICLSVLELFMNIIVIEEILLLYLKKFTFSVTISIWNEILKVLFLIKISIWNYCI